jgi:chloramphenicol-sensitive protein RarD
MNRPSPGTLPGNLLAAGAYLIWGALPLFWACLDHVDPFIVLSFRVLFSLAFLCLIFFSAACRMDVRRAFSDKKILARTLTASLFLFLNWGLFIWGLAHGYHIDASLGYFMSPLIQVVLGAVVLKEKMSAGTVVAFVLALAAVVYMAAAQGIFPWYAISLAGTFSVYGLIKKQTGLNAYSSLFLESAFSSPICIGILVYFANTSGVPFGQDFTTTALLVLSGVVTAVPLVLFGMAAKKITLTTLGFIQYLSPTCQLLLGIFAFHETVEPFKLLGFALIWTALVIYSVTSLVKPRRLAEKTGLS